MRSLKTVLDTLNFERKMHVSVHDVSGILDAQGLELEFSYRIHKCPFCDSVKKEPDGFSVCLENKIKTIERATKEKLPFWHVCPFGICEYVYPVVKNGDTKCIVYVSNMTEKDGVQISKEALQGAEAADALLFLFEETVESRVNREMAETTGEIVGCHIINLSENVHIPEDHLHRAVRSAMEYARDNFVYNITLENVADLNCISAKYLGQLFKQQTGQTYSEYLNDIRLSEAEKQLRTTDRKIIDIALECGFNNVTYFNRLFSRRFHTSPRRYRAENSRHP